MAFLIPILMKSIFFLTLICFSITVFGQTDTKKQEVKDFGLAVIQKYYDGKCAEVYDCLADVVVAFEGGMRVKKIMFTTEDFCAAQIFNNLKINNYSTYLSNYTPEVLDQQEFESRFKNFWMKLEPGDFYFDGTVKTGKQELFTTGDLARFILRKTTDGKFQIISI